MKSDEIIITNQMLNAGLEIEDQYWPTQDHTSEECVKRIYMAMLYFTYP